MMVINIKKKTERNKMVILPNRMRIYAFLFWQSKEDSTSKCIKVNYTQNAYIIMQLETFFIKKFTTVVNLGA